MSTQSKLGPKKALYDSKLKAEKIAAQAVLMIELIRNQILVRYLHYLSFLLLLLGSCIYLYNTYKSNKFQTHYEAQILVNGFSSELIGKLNERLMLTKSLAAFVKHSEYNNIDNPLHLITLEDDFYRFTNSLHNDFSDILSMQLAPEGKVKYLTNLERNQEALGHDLFIDDERREQVITTIKSRNNIVAGPLNLIQGGEAIIARQAIFTREGAFNPARVISNGRANEYDQWVTDVPSDFWGFATVLIDSQLIKDVAENWNSDRFNIAIRGRHGLGRPGEIFEGNEDVFKESIAELEVEFDGGSWLVAASTNVSYFKLNDVGIFIFTIFTSITISILIKNSILERKKLTEQAQKDPLTKAFNRLKIRTEVQNCIEHYQRYGVGFCIIMFDIDKFKSINDNFGHAVGDDVLKSITDLFSNYIRKTDIFARYGGEEFIILCPNTPEINAIALAERLRALLSDTNFEIVGKVTASFGVSSFSEHDSLDSLYKRADDGIYQAKNNGRNDVCFVPIT